MKESPPEGYPRHPPPSARHYRTFYTWWTTSAICKCEIYSRDLLAGEGEGGVICETMPFVKGSSYRLQTEDQDSQYFSVPLLIRQDSPNSYWWLLASFGKFIYWSEAIKGSRSQWPALSRLHYVLQSTPLWRKEVGHSNTRGTVRLCSFSLKYCYT